MSFGFGFGFPKNYIAALFSPAQLFTGSTNGAWYDPSDFSTLFQDAAGTTPVTAVEQPVGLMLDKSKNGVGTNGAKRVNLLTKTEQFNDTNAWARINVDVGLDAAIAPNGTITADIITATNTRPIIVQTVTSLAAAQYKYSVAIKKGLSFTLSLDNGFNAGIGATFDGSTGAYITNNVLGSGYVLNSYSCVTHPSDANYWLASINVTTPSTSNTYLGVWINKNQLSGYPTSGLASIGDTLTVWGADLRVASEASTLPTYQKITDTWYNTLPGNHAFNSSGNSANFPVLSARYNLLTKTEDFSDAVWSKVGVFVSAPSITGTTTNPSGTVGAAQVIAFSGVNNDSVSILSQTVTLSTNKHSFSIYIRANSAGDIGKKLWITVYDTAYRSTTNFTLTASYQRIEITPTIVTARSCLVRFGAAGTNYGGVNQGAVSVDVWGADLRVSNDALNQPAYQRVNTSTDYDTVGFKPYLSFNGVNQWLQTNSIDFTYGDKMFVSAGVRRLTDATEGMVVESSTDSLAQAGAFSVDTSPGGIGRYRWVSRGTSAATVADTSSAPITNVLSGIGNISGDQAILRVNGTQAAISTSDQGIGTYGNYQMYIGARAGTSLWFNGRLYGLVVAGKQASASEIASTEAWLNQKTGAY